MLKLPRYILAFTRALLLIIPMGLMIFGYLIASKLFFKHTYERAFLLRRLYLRYTNFILGIRSEVQGEASLHNALYVSNHRSLSDPLILCQFLDAYIIAKAEVADYPLISTGAELTGILYVKRQNKDSRAAVRVKMKETLASGHNVLVYPEGTVNKELGTLPYRQGTFREIKKMGIPLVPVCLEYRDSKDVWHNRNMIQHFFLQFGYWRTRAKLIIGDSIDAKDGDELCRKAEEWTNSTIIEIHKNWPASHFNKIVQLQNAEK